MWNYRRSKEAANQDLLSFVLHSRGMGELYSEGYHKQNYAPGYSYGYDRERNWYGHQASMYISDFIHNGADINCRDGMGNTPLIHAASARDPELASLLVNKFRADINAQNTYGDTPLTVAIITGHTTLAQELLLAGAKTDPKNAKGETAASLAAKSPVKEIQELAPYIKGEKPLSDITKLQKQQELNRSLFRAASGGNPKEVTFAIEQGADPNATDSKGCTPLMLAYGNDAAAELLAKGAKIDAQNNEGKTALHFAAEQSKPQKAEALLKAGADPSIADKSGKTAADCAGDSKTGDLIEDEILKRGGNTPELIAARDKKRATRALFEALNRGEFLDVPALLKNGADPYAATWKGHNALTASIAAQTPSGTAVLLAAGIDPNKANSNGDTPLYVAFREGRYRTAAALVKNGASPDVTLADGETLLNTAISQRNSEFAAMLIENKADITKPNQKGETPLDAAFKAGDMGETIKALAKAGAPINAQDADGNTLLMKALNDNRERTAWGLIEAGADVTAKNAKGESAADIAGRYGSTRLYHEIKKREEAARDARIAQLEEQVKQLGGDVTKPATVIVAAAAKAPVPARKP
jgi:ankyrin repeat protein